MRLGGLEGRQASDRVQCCCGAGLWPAAPAGVGPTSRFLMGFRSPRTQNSSASSRLSPVASKCKWYLQSWEEQSWEEAGRKEADFLLPMCWECLLASYYWSLQNSSLKAPGASPDCVTADLGNATQGAVTPADRSAAARSDSDPEQWRLQSGHVGGRLQHMRVQAYL